MEVLISQLRQLCSSLLQRLNQLFTGQNSRSVQITGVLGLAALLYSFYHIQNNYRTKHRRQDLAAQQRQDSSARLSDPGQASSSRASSSIPPAPGTKSSEAQRSNEPKPRNVSNLQWAIKSRLSGVQAVTISAPGVLLEEGSVQELEESATLRREAVEILREMAHHTSMYIITQVTDDLGEATCRGALEAAGLVGGDKGQIPPQRLLFCSTLEGKASIVRQLEPQLHIDAHPRTIEDLKRFIRLVHICPPGQSRAGIGSANVSSASSLAAIFA